MHICQHLLFIHSQDKDNRDPGTVQMYYLQNVVNYDFAYISVCYVTSYALMFYLRNYTC